MRDTEAAQDWQEELAHIFERDAFASDIPLPCQETETCELLRPFTPFLQSGLARLQAEVEGLVRQGGALPFDPQAIYALLLPNLTRQLLPVVDKTLVLELHIARLRGQLRGETPRQRFQEYIQLVRRRENLLPLLQEYSVLTRQILMTVHLWVECSLEFLRRLCADWATIVSLFIPEGQDPGILVEAVAGAGDTHRGGRSVMTLKFRSGFQLVYKPKSLAIDKHFQELLLWLNKHGARLVFYPLKLLERETYGWTEYIAAADCLSVDEVARFYERQGAFLAILYALKAVDIHAENIIAAGEYPVLIDLEALFHPDVKFHVPSSERLAFNAIRYSVLHTALLPQRFRLDNQFTGIDISGLGSAEGQFTSPLPRWQDTGTDQMKLVRQRVRLQASSNCPKLNGRSAPASDYIDSLIHGFTLVYRLLCEQREAFLTECLPRFARDEVRFIARATHSYAVFLAESFHPNMLRDAMKRERFFEKLRLCVERQPYLARLISAEREDLGRGDIPLFTACPASRDLYTSQGRRIPAFFEESGLELVQRRLQQLDEQDLQRQVWMIRAAFTGMGGDGSHPSVDTGAQRSSQTVVGRERLISAAQAIGDCLSASALRGEYGADWFGITPVQEREWLILPAGLDLHSGLPGIILFLSYLGSITGAVSYSDLASLALETLRVEIERFKVRPDWALPGEAGICNKSGSCIYLFSHLAALWREPMLLQEAEELIPLLLEHIGQDVLFDIVDGSAGCVAALLSLYTVAPSASTLAAAITCGDHLLAHAQSSGPGVGWRTLHQPTPLAGFARGNAGIAWALFRLAAVTGEERFRRTAIAALAYERSVLSPERQNWPDLRSQLERVVEQDHQVEQVLLREQSYCMAWSHGAPGIALGRLAVLPYYDDAAIREEFEIALKATLAGSFGYHHKHIGANHSLYHGDLGNLETLLVAAERLNVPQYHELLERKVSWLFERSNRSGWLTGVPLNVETPGLLIGLSGIGYELLRLAVAEQVPSVLLLEPPR